MGNRLFSKWTTKSCYFMFLRLLMIYFPLIKCVRTVDNKTLAFVIVLYRHGDRSPIGTFPNDPYQEAYWPQGFGQLSQIGMLEEFNLGQYLKERYIDSGFLNATYNRKQIHVRSTDYDRTLMSAQSVLAGLYPPQLQQSWREGINWQPIPVHTIPQALDKIFYNFPCPRLNEIDQVWQESKANQDLEDRYKDTVIMLNNYTGFNATQLSSHELHLTFDALLCEDHHSLSLPSWATEELRKDIHGVFSHLTYHSYNTTLQRRLRGGLFIQEYVRFVQNFINSKNQTDLESPRFVMFSAHDSTVLKLLGTLGMLNNESVPYSTMVMVEMHQSVPNPEQYFLQFWYRNDTQRAPYQLQLPGCAVNCPLEDFLTLTKPLIPDDLDLECMSSHLIILGLDLSNLWTVMLVTVGVGLVVLILLIMCVVYCCRRSLNQRKVRRYGRLRAETIPEEVPMINSLGNGSDLDD